MTEETNVSQFILRRLNQLGIHHIFGVPGDFALGFFNEILKSNVKYIGTCNELNAAYAADAYARINGASVCSTTYAVGELSAINGVAGAYAEDLCVIHIGGIPSRKHLKLEPLLHHTLGDYKITLKMYSMITCAAVVLDDIDKVIETVDNVLQRSLAMRKPVYIGIPSDIVKIKLEVPVHFPFNFPKPPEMCINTFNAAVDEAFDLIKSSEKPIFIPGVYMKRYRLEEVARKFVEKTNIPFVTMMLSKSIIDECHERFIGLYCGERSMGPVMRCFSESDCVLLVGEKLTDFNTGNFTHKFPKNLINVQLNKVQIKTHVYENVYMEPFITKLLDKLIEHKINKNYLIPIGSQEFVHRPSIQYEPEKNENLTMKRFGDSLVHFFRPKSVVIAETGASMFTAVEILLPPDTIFIGQTFYGSIGYTVGATLGACAAASDRNIYLLIGDGSFQVTCQDISTMMRYNYKPIIFLVNNDGYSIERAIVDRVYNDLQPWKYSQLPLTMGDCHTFDVHTEDALQEVLDKAHDLAKTKLVFIEIHLDRWDFCEGLRSAGQNMAKNNGLLE